jgi:hypothetical protein
LRVSGLEEALNKSSLARRWLCGMGCAKGDDANEIAQGGAVSSEGRCDPAAGCKRPNSSWRGLASPPLPDPRFAGPLGLRSGEPSCCAPWHRSPGYDLRRTLYDHPDFTSNALSEDLFRASLSAQRGLIQGFLKQQVLESFPTYCGTSPQI